MVVWLLMVTRRLFVSDPRMLLKTMLVMGIVAGRSTTVLIWLPFWSLRLLHCDPVIVFDQRCLTRLEVRYNRPSLFLVQDLPCTAFHLIARVDGLLYQAAFLGLSTLSEQLTEGGNYHRETLKKFNLYECQGRPCQTSRVEKRTTQRTPLLFCLAIILPLLLFPSHTTLFLPTFNFFSFSSTSKPPTAVATTTASPSTTRSSTKPKWCQRITVADSQGVEEQEVAAVMVRTLIHTPTLQDLHQQEEHQEEEETMVKGVVLMAEKFLLTHEICRWRTRTRHNQGWPSWRRCFC